MGNGLCVDSSGLRANWRPVLWRCSVLFWGERWHLGQCGCWVLSAHTLTGVYTSDRYCKCSFGLIPPAGFTSMPRKAKLRPVPKPPAAFPRSPTPLVQLMDASLGIEKATTSDLPLPLLLLLKTLQLGGPLNVTQVLFWCDKLLRSSGEPSVPSPNWPKTYPERTLCPGPQQQGLLFPPNPPTQPRLRLPGLGIATIGMNDSIVSDEVKDKRVL